MTTFDQMPLLVVFIVTLALSLLATEFGFRFGGWLDRRRPDEERGAATAPLTGALFGLLAFILAFVMSFAINQFQTRRQLVVADANTIGTTYLRTSYLDEPEATESRELLREYVDLRLEAVETTTPDALLPRMEAIQNELWTIAVDQGRAQPESEMIGLFVESLNEMIDMHTTRLTYALGSRVPQVMWLMLYGLAIVSFVLAGIANSTDGKRHMVSTGLFSVGFSVVLLLIVDLDRSQQGVLTVSQRAMTELQRQISNE